MSELVISAYVLESAGVLVLFGILTVVFVHLFRKKIDNIGFSFLGSILLSLFLISGIYSFSIIEWFEHFEIVYEQITTETSLIFLAVPIIFGAVLIILGNYLSERMTKQQYRSFYHSIYGIIVVGILGVSADIALLFLAISLMLLLIAEYLRLSDDESSLTLYVKKVLNKPLRSYEKRGYVASFSYISGMMLVIIFLPPGLAIGSGLILSLGDPAAALVGRKFGKYKFKHNPDKSLEGSLAMFLVSFLALTGASYLSTISFLSVTIDISVTMALFAALSAVILESFDLKASDNLLIPIFAGIVLFAV